MLSTKLSFEADASWFFTIGSWEHTTEIALYLTTYWLVTVSVNFQFERINHKKQQGEVPLVGIGQTASVSRWKQEKPLAWQWNTLLHRVVI